MARKITNRVVQVVAVVVAATTASNAFGFYFLGWPGGPKDPPSLLTPSAGGHNDSPGQAINPSPPPTSTPNPKSGSNPTPPAPPGLPGGGGQKEPTAPEPGTLMMAAIGLGLAGLIRSRRQARRRSSVASPPSPPGE